MLPLTFAVITLILVDNGELETGDHNSGTINKEDRGGAGMGLRRALHDRGSLSQLWVLLSVA